MRAAQDPSSYEKLIAHWMENRYTLRYTGGLVPDICQQFTKGYPLRLTYTLIHLPCAPLPLRT